MSVAYGPDGKLIACGTQIGSVHVFDVESGKHVSTLEGHYKPVRSITFTPGNISNAHENEVWRFESFCCM